MEQKILFGQAKSESLSPFHTLRVESRDFLPSEKIEIRANTLYEASQKFGELQKEIVQDELRLRLSLKTSEEQKQLFSDAQFQLDRITELQERGIFRVNGIDYLARYMQAVDGFAKGAGITQQEAALLQSEIMAGCQTMIVQDKKTGNIGFLHTEENVDDLKLAEGEYRYKHVRMIIGDNAVQFLSYPGLAGWGAAFGINEKTRMVQLVDDLVVNHDKGLGDVWANAMAFMSLDAGRLNIIDGFIRNIQNADPPVLFTGGYALHCIEGKQQPEMRSIEFAGESISVVPPSEDRKKTFVVQVNAPRDKNHKILAEYRVPTIYEPWDAERAQLGIEMSRRMKRLIKWGKREQSLTANQPSDVIASGLKILAMPEGDIEEIEGVRSVTGLANEVVVAHGVGYVGEQGMHVVFGKATPEPISGKEYSFQTEGNPYARTELSKLTKRREAVHTVLRKFVTRDTNTKDR